MVRVFVSQPMHGKTLEEIEKFREDVVWFIKHICGADVELIDNVNIRIPEDAPRLVKLGRSIQLMADADLVVFHHNWEEAPGCCVEHEACVQYNKQFFIYGEF